MPTTEGAAETNDRVTIISMAVLAIAAASLLHEGLGHGVTAYVRGDIPTQLTSNHLSDIRPDRLVDAAGTLVNLIAGALAMYLSTLAGRRANIRYFLWLLGTFNLLDGAGYFAFSGILGVGDWQEVIAGLPYYLALRIAMSIFGIVFYYFAVVLIARLLRPFCPTYIYARTHYNTLGRIPYYAACAFYCLAGAFDPLGIKVLFLSTIPASFGGHSGLLWADNRLPRTSSPSTTPLIVTRQPAWWISAILIGLAYILILGRGINFTH